LGSILKPGTIRNVLIRVSQAFLGGASEGEIRKWVGHRDSRIVERYWHLRPQDAQRKTDRMTFFEELPAPVAITAVAPVLSTINGKNDTIAGVSLSAGCSGLRKPPAYFRQPQRLKGELGSQESVFICLSHWDQ
jgi:hypothetical protein